jgi:hypothetical protein
VGFTALQLTFSLVTADYPYINYYVINKPREEAGQFYTANKARRVNPSESI